MKKKTQIRLLGGIVSPYGLAFFSYAVFLFSCSVPPAFYSRHINEPDLMFLDPVTILFYTLGVASFVAGLLFVDWLFPSRFVDRRLDIRVSPIVFLLAPIILGILITVITTLRLLDSYPIILVSLLTQHGEDIKDTMATEINGYFGLVPNMLIGLTWWTFWRYSDLSLEGWRKRLARFSIFAAVLCIIVSCFLTMSRGIIMIALCGLAVLYLPRRLEKTPRVGKFMLQSGLSFGLAIPLLFIAFTFLRGTDNMDALIDSFLGYTVASYNRMAAALHGDLHLPYSGHGIAIGGIVVTSHLLPFRAYLNMPESSIDLFGSSFLAVSQAGLEGTLVWEGIFADIIGDLGWFFIPFLFSYGMFYSIMWKCLKQGNVFAVVLYPWLGFCILFWIGGNYLLGQPLEGFLFVTILLFAYELALVKPVNLRAGKRLLS